jgi:hypothetical protein
MTQYSVAMRNAMLDAQETVIGTSPKLYLYSGVLGANCAAADPSGTLLTMNLPSDWMAAASSGQKTLLGTWSAQASAAGVAASYRIKDSTGTTCHEQGTVGMSGADMILDNTNLAINQTVTVISKTVTCGGA